MNRDDEECLVYCRQCNGYLYSISIYESNGRTAIIDTCPFKCKSEGGITVMKVPEGFGGPRFI